MSVDSIEIEGILAGMADESAAKPAKKAARSARLGASGEAVRLNVRQIRDAQGVSGASLSAALKRLGRPIPLVGIQRIESGERRVDVDDLMALAVALGVSPITLLMPPAKKPDELVDATGSAKPVQANRVWDWLAARDVLDQAYTDDLLAFYQRSLPAWEQGVVTEQYRLFIKQSRDMP